MPLVEGAQPQDLDQGVAQIPAPAPQPAGPSFLDVAAAAERQSNLAGTLYDRLVSPRPDAPAKPGFDPLASVPKGYEEYADRFLDAESPDDVGWIKGRIDRELADRQTIARAGAGGFAASMAAGLTDPLTLASMLIPGGGETRLAQAARLALISGGTSAAQEGAMHALTETRTASESAFNIAGSTLLGGILGAAIRPHVPPKVADEIGENLSHELHEPQGGDAVLGPAQRSVLDTALPSDVPEVRAPESAAFEPAEAEEAAARGSVQAPQDAMLAEFERTTEEHPTQPGQRLVNGNVGAELVRDPLDPNVVHIETIRANEPGQGQGAAALSKITELADKHGATLTLDAIPMDSEGIDPEALRAFYGKHGFVPAEGGLLEGRAMVRPVAVREMRSVGLEGNSRDAQEVAIVQRALGLDGERVESLARSHENDREAFIQAVQEFVDGHAEAARGGEAGTARSGATGREQAGGLVGATASREAARAGRVAPPAGEAVTSAEHINPGEESTTGAAAVSRPGLQAERIARGARTIAEGPIGRVAPGLRLLTSDSLEARRLVQELVTTPETLQKNLSGVATAQPIERQLWRNEGVWWQGWKARGDLFRTYRQRMRGLGQKPLSRREFNEQVSFAMRRGDQSPVPEIADAARKTRALVFDPLKVRAQKLGLLPEDSQLNLQLQRGGTDSYLMRQYDARKIRENLTGWLDTLTEGFKQQGVDPAEARDIAHKVTRNVLGSERGTLDLHVMDDILPGSGRFKERTLQLPDRLLEPYLTSDIDSLSHAYLRSMAPEVEFTERFGTRDMADQLDDVRDEYSRLMEQAKARGEDPAPLEKQMKGAVRDLQALRDRLYGIFGQPKDPGYLPVRIGRMLRSDNALRLLGAATLAHFPDMANVIMRYGLPRTFTAIGRILSSSQALALTRTESKRMGAALDMVMNLTASILGDYGSHSQFVEQRAMAKATRFFTITTGETPLITAVQSLTSTLAQDDILRAAERVAAGTALPKRTVVKLASAGLDTPMLQRIAREGAAHTRIANGLRFGMSDQWADQGAAAAFESAVLKEAHGVTLRPGAGDTPLFMSSELGKSILQFKTFAFAANRIVVNPLLQGVSRGDLNAIQGLFALAFMGTASYVAKQKAAGQPVELNHPGRLAMEVLDKSNLLGWTGEAIFPLLWQFGMRDLSRWSDRDALETLLGPSAGTVGDIFERRFPSKLTASGAADDGSEETKPFARSDLHFLRRLMPGQNLWYFRRGVNALEDAVGDAFDLPGQSQKEHAEQIAEAQ